MKDKRLLYALLFVGLFVLAIEMIWLAPITLTRWQPYDYGLYAQMGEQFLRGGNPYGMSHYWPLYTIFWVFSPLSLLPAWFRFAWILIPMISLLIIHKRDGLILLLFTPLWMVIADAMIDGILILPAYWLLQDAAIGAGVGIVALLLKPQLAFLAIAGRFVQWLREKKWRQVQICIIAMAILVLPSFFLWPNWPMAWLKVLPLRAAETTTILPLMSGSVWSWWALGLGGKVVALVLVTLALWLFGRSWRGGHGVVALMMMGLFLLPFLFASNLFIAAAALRGRRQIELATALSLVAWLVDRWASPFAGVYALIPLLILWFYRE